MPLHATLIQKLLSTNSHIGRRLTSNHLKPHLSAVRNTLPILDSDKTLISLRSALAFISHLSSSSPNSRFLFVNTNPLYDPIFDLMTRLTGHPSFLSPQAQFWRAPGFLTNPHSPKRFRGRNKRLCFAPVEAPDCVVVVDTEGKCSVVNEAERVGVPVVAIVNSGVDGRVFEKVAYPVVVGTETVEFVYLFCNLVTKTFLSTRGKGIAGVLDDFNVDVGVDGDLEGNVDGSGSGGGVFGDDGGVMNANASGSSGVFGGNANVDASGGESGVFGDDGGVMNAYTSGGSGVFGDDGGVMNASGSGDGVLGGNDNVDASGGESGVFGDDGGVMNAYTSGSSGVYANGSGGGVFREDGGFMNDNMSMDGSGSGSGGFGEDGYGLNDSGNVDTNGNVDGTFGTTPTISP